eukprot:gene3963-579_t
MSSYYNKNRYYYDRFWRSPVGHWPYGYWALKSANRGAKGVMRGATHTHHVGRGGNGGGGKGGKGINRGNGKGGNGGKGGKGNKGGRKFNVNDATSGATETVGNHDNMKEKRMCWEFERKGKCRYGGNCKFSNEKDEAKPAPKEICKNFARQGKCKFGEHCKYAHEKDSSEQEQCRFWAAKKKCPYGKDCWFKHGSDGEGSFYSEYEKALRESGGGTDMKQILKEQQQLLNKVLENAAAEKRKLEKGKDEKDKLLWQLLDAAEPGKKEEFNVALEDTIKEWRQDMEKKQEELDKREARIKTQEKAEGFAELEDLMERLAVPQRKLREGEETLHNLQQEKTAIEIELRKCKEKLDENVRRKNKGARPAEEARKELACQAAAIREEKAKNTRLESDMKRRVGALQKENAELVDKVAEGILQNSKMGNDIIQQAEDRKKLTQQVKTLEAENAKLKKDAERSNTTAEQRESLMVEKDAFIGDLERARRARGQKITAQGAEINNIKEEAAAQRLQLERQKQWATETIQSLQRQLLTMHEQTKMMSEEQQQLEEAEKKEARKRLQGEEQSDRVARHEEEETRREEIEIERDRAKLGQEIEKEVGFAKLSQRLEMEVDSEATALTNGQETEGRKTGARTKGVNMDEERQERKESLREQQIDKRQVLINETRQRQQEGNEEATPQPPQPQPKHQPLKQPEQAPPLEQAEESNGKIKDGRMPEVTEAKTTPKGGRAEEMTAPPSPVRPPQLLQEGTPERGTREDDQNVSQASPSLAEQVRNVARRMAEGTIERFSPEKKAKQGTKDTNPDKDEGEEKEGKTKR